MDRIINLRLFTLPNILAIGAVIFFWACMAYVVETNLSGGTAS